MQSWDPRQWKKGMFCLRGAMELSFLFCSDEEMASRTGLFLALFKGNDGERRLLKFLFADFCRVSLRSNILQVPYTSGIF